MIRTARRAPHARMVAALIVILTVAPANAQRQSGNQSTGQQSLGNARGGTGGGAGGFQGGNATPGEISTDAGGSEGVNRQFGEGLVGRGDSADRFVGNQEASPTGRAANRADFSDLNRQRATPPTPPSSPVRVSLRLNLTPQSSPLALTPATQARLLMPSRLVTQRALDGVSPGIAAVPAMDGAVLTGTADTQHERKLAEAILRLQPGVRSIENRIVVSPSIPPIP